MKLISELVTEQVKLLVEEDSDDKEKKNYFIEGVFLQGNLKNRNGRVYPMEVLDKEVERYNKEYIEKNRAYGELGHPQGPTINLERVSHMVKGLEKQAVKKSEQTRKELGKGSEQGQTSRTENSKKWWKFWE